MLAKNVSKNSDNTGDTGGSNPPPTSVLTDISIFMDPEDIIDTDIFRIVITPIGSNGPPDFSYIHIYGDIFEATIYPGQTFTYEGYVCQEYDLPTDQEYMINVLGENKDGSRVYKDATLIVWG